MPTIDELNPVAAASDTDQIPVSQNGSVRKVSRAQLLDGTQAEIALPSRRLLGRSSPGTGAAEAVAVGAGLALDAGVLSLAATGGLDIASLPPGTVPAGVEIVPISQNGGDVGVTYAQFLSGLPNVANVSASNMTVKATGSTATQKMADFAANTLPKSGGQMSGPLVLAAAPFLANQATTKAYTDSADAARVAKAGDTMTGPLVLQADPITALGAATRQYADNGDAARVLKSGDTMTGQLTVPSLSAFQFGYGVASQPVKMQLAGSNASTVGVMDVSQQTTHSGGTEAAVRPMVSMTLQVGNASNGGTLDGPADNRWVQGNTLFTSALKAAGTSATRSQHGVGFAHVIRNLPTGGVFPPGKTGTGLWNAWWVTQDRTNQPTSVTGALVGLEHDITANNRDDRGLRFHRQVTLQAETPLSQGGQPLEWAYGDYFNSVTGNDRDSFFRNVIAIYAGYTESGIDFSLGTGERANPYVDGVNRAAAIRMRAGQRIAFDGDGATGKVLTFDGTAQEWQFRANGTAVLRIAANGTARFSGPPVLPSYTVASLPAGQNAGAKAFASNGRKPGEAAGTGTGMEVFFDGTAWISSAAGAAIAA